MVLTYENRKGDTYYLHQSLKAKRKFFFSKNEDGKLVEKIPEGYEIYENPNGLVFLRKERPKVFSDEEIAVVENGIRDYTDLKFYKIDVKGNTVIILLPLQDVHAIKEAISQSSDKTPKEITNILNRFITFAPEMQLILTDEKKHIFSLKRYCYRGLGSWITLETSSDLKGLTKKYFRHLAKESFFDLFAEF